MAEKRERKGLGRGLSALMADVTPAAAETAGGEAPRADALIPIDRIYPNPEQPRRAFSAERLKELETSIRENGIIQPLIVRPDPKDGRRFQIVAGERRWRAAQMAQVHEVPAIVRDYDDRDVLQIAILENIQRDDLNPIEEAAGYRQLMDRFGYTQERMSEALGKSRSHIANLLRLLALPEGVQALVIDGRLSAGHARALVTAEDPDALAAEVVRRGLSVRQTEALAKGPKDGPRKHTGPRKDADTRALESDLMAALGMRVGIDHGGDGSGTVTIRYGSLDQLDELCRKLSATAEMGGD